MTRAACVAVLGLVAANLVLALGRPAEAHPHVWIDLRTAIILNESGQVTGIEQEWLFDPIYSAYAADGIDPQSDDGKRALAEMIDTSLTNLHDYDYFMRVRADGARQAFDLATDRAADIRQDRLVYRFTVPLAEPVDPVALPLDVAVFDPTYYIEMLHLEGDVVALRGGNPAGCSARIVEPTPNMEAVVFARSLDQGAAPDNTLGAQFAETVILQCG